jgi:IS5 family transposase
VSIILLPVQQSLQPSWPTIEGSVEYNQFRDQLSRMDQLLVETGVEQRFVGQTYEQWQARVKFANVSAKTQVKIQIHASRALRCNIARTLLKEDYRGFAVRLADSPLLQQFCGLVEIDRIQVPAKSTLQRYSQWADESTVRELINELNALAHFHPGQLDLEEKLDLETCFLDCTCIEANIHYPVDWVLLRDGTRTMMKAVILIRGQGLRHRMEAPELFIKKMNQLCIKMTHARAKSDSKKHRKKVFRAMDKLIGKIARHAKSYRQILNEQWEKTEWSRAEAEQILRRLDNVIDQLPEARRQARERIIQEQQVPSKEKILSLYEPDVQVIVRKKAGAEVEFGNTLLLGETPSGVIVDWQLYKDVAPNDVRLLRPSVERIEQNLGVHIGALGGDRGFDSESNREFLLERNTYNGICPKNPRELREKNKSWKFKGLQRRRSQTEARIAIVKNVFLGAPVRSKGFPNRELTITWAVLTHNLWVIARLPQRKKKAELKAA